VRRLIAISSAVLCASATLSIVTATPVSAAAVPPPSGTISCSVAGVVQFAPGLGLLPNAKGGKLKIDMTGSSCDNAGVSGGKAPITDVAMKAVGSLSPGGSCFEDSVVNMAKTFKLTTKWQNRNVSNKVTTVSASKSTLVSSVTSGAHWEFVFNAPAKNAFAGTPSSLQIDVGIEVYDIFALCQLPGGARSIPFSGTLTVA
jgi:hypothetical protein